MPQVGAKKCSVINTGKCFVCRDCTDQPAMTSVDIGDDASLEYKLCYLDDMLSVVGDDDTAVEAGVVKDGINLDNLRLPVRTSSFVSEGSYAEVVCKVVTLHGSESWLAEKEKELALHQAEMRVIAVGGYVMLKQEIGSRVMS